MWLKRIEKFLKAFWSFAVKLSPFIHYNVCLAWITVSWTILFIWGNGGCLKWSNEQSCNSVSPGRCRWHTCGTGCAGRAGWPRVWRTSPGTPGRSAASPGSPWRLLGRRRAQNCLLMEAWSPAWSSSPPGAASERSEETEQAGKHKLEDIQAISSIQHPHIQSGLFLLSKKKLLQFLVVFSLRLLFRLLQSLLPQLSIPLPSASLSNPHVKTLPCPCLSPTAAPLLTVDIFSCSVCSGLGYCLNCVPQPEHRKVRPRRRITAGVSTRVCTKSDTSERIPVA